MTENQVLFISDAHLGAEDVKTGHDREKILVAFLRESLKSGDRLFIVGDLFDFWFEYLTVIPKQGILILSCLRELSEKGVRIDYVAGNHDFWVGDFFRQELGLFFHSEPVEEIIDGKRFFIIHGDGVKRRDAGYRMLKKVFRNRFNIVLYRWLHPDIGIPFAKWCSGSSRKYTSKKDYGGNEEYLDFAKYYFEKGFDYVVMGHTHDPVFERIDVIKAFVNIGDWIEHFSYVRFFNGELTLESYRPDMSTKRPPV
ncbi:UDP-2,3-diacylglucosamine diphosphatase [candidate division KSB1 bacterium]